ncbi:MAG: MBL fold metallo-hydrolase [Candidatus Berkelbacteria bacterium]|nr:MBL fold metallo-hydrolase [Candidatus Berkelbacteria bacterium]
MPKDHWLVVDAGTGFIPLSDEALKAGVKGLTVLSTHYHPDHTQGALMSSLVHRKVVQLYWYGPQENGTGPLQMLQTEMKPPRFPVAFAEVASHFTCKGIEHPSGKVIVIHPEGGLRLLTVEELERIEAAAIPQVAMGKARYPLGSCLVIRMLRSNHPERTISYRFEERPTGRVFAFLTDHENQDGIPRMLRAHLSGADLLVMDCQYTREAYDDATAGFGHGTPDFCARVSTYGRGQAPRADPPRSGCFGCSG